MAGRKDYAERKEARIDRLNAASEKAATQSAAEAKRSHDLVKDIPFGQPNIVGRPALPRLREKSVNAMERAIEKDKTAAYYADKAEAAENNTAISSDDPEAVAKLEAKIERLEAERERIKAFNKEARKNGTEPAPWYALPYLSRDIKAAKERIAKLNQIDDIPAEVIEFDGGTVEVDNDLNRVVVRHDEKPDSDVITALKSNGFHWSRAEKAWMRLKSLNAIAAAKKICGIQEDS